MVDIPAIKKLVSYQQIMERIFFWHYKDGDREVAFERADMERAAQELGIDLPKNLGDIPYTFRYRGLLPDSIRVKDKLGIVQIEQDFALCADKFPSLICRPIAAQFIEDDGIALFEFEEGEKGVVITSEKHYRLVPSDNLTMADLDTYRARTEQ